MLEGFGSALKKGFDKIAGAVFLDKKTIETAVKELQRALIQADVNVYLVKELGDKIKKEALDEKIKGIEKKEHLIKILHDEIINLIGKEKHELKIEKGKKTKIMLLGLYGSGKCIHAKTKVNLSSGEISEIKDIYDNYSQKENKQILEDGEVVKLDKELFVKSFNPKTLKIEDKKITHLWKLKKEELYEIRLDNGNDFSIKVTPEHPFFVLKNGFIEKVRADQISEGDFIAAPRDIEINGKSQDLFEDLKKQNLEIYLTPEEIKEYLPKKENTLMEICKNLKNKRNYCSFTYHLKRGKIPIEIITKDYPNIIKIKDNNACKIISFPTSLTIEFAEFLGYLLGDGNIRPNYVQVSNEDPEIIERIRILSKHLFNIEPCIKKAKRTKNMYDIRICSTTLVKLMSIFGLKPGKKGKNLKIPNQIILSDNEVMRSFIKAYFDCDSSPLLNKRSIELSSESKILIEQMNMLLKRFGIVSTISKKVVNNIGYWRLIIKAKYAEKYAEKIGYLITRKQKRVEKYNLIGINEGSGKEDMIPVGKLLKEIRLSKGFSIGEIQEQAVYSYGIYERKGFISREKLQRLVNYYKIKRKGMFLDLLNSIKNNDFNKKYSSRIINGVTYQLKNWELINKDKNQLILTNKGEEYLQQISINNSEKLIDFLEYLAFSNVCWLEINNIKRIKNDEEYVYDLTVEDNHSFVAEGFIVHNTTSASKLAAYYSKRGLKVAMLGLDVHRPAAKEQLEQLGAKIKVPVFVDKKENNALKTYNQFKSQLEDFDLTIIDTAGRHSLDQELVDEITELSKKINPDYTLLVIQADIGQAAKTQASEFQKACNINGVIITRMDSTAKAGGALTACNETNAPVYFIGTGEKPNDFETFNPQSFISRLLGLGDLEGLLEKVESAVDQGSQKKLKKKLEEGKFDLRDFQEQLKQMGNVGSFSKIMEMIPGLSKAKIPEEMLGTSEAKLKKWQYAIDSMTKDEIENPEILEKQTARLGRIAKGSGTTTTDIRQMIKQYKLLKELASGSGDLENFDPSQGLNQKQMQKIARKFGKKMKF